MEGSKERPAWCPPTAYVSSSLEEYMNDLVVFINKYCFLYQFKSIEFFMKSVWDTIPESWKEPLLAMSDEEAAAFPQGKIIKPDWPQSLTDFLNDINKLTMPRDINNEIILPIPPKTTLHTTQSSSDHTSLPPVNTADAPLVAHTEATGDAAAAAAAAGEFSLPALTRNMSAKKIHEVVKLSKLVCQVKDCLQDKYVDVVDVGSGEGYLGQVLHHEYGLSVVGVDERSEFTEGAQQRALFIHKERKARDRKGADQKAKQTNDERGVGATNTQAHTQAMSMVQAQSQAHGVRHVVATITLDMDPHTFELLVWPNTAGSDRSAVLVGLHTCGVLANAMLRLFILSKPFHALVDVGCCYYRKQPDMEYELMSSLGRQLASHSNLQLTPGALKLACEAVCRMTSEGKDEYTYSMESHFFRTLLETALNQHYPTGHSFNIRGLPRKKASTFHLYSRLAVDRITSQVVPGSTNNNSESLSTSLDVQGLLNSLDQIYDEKQSYYHHVNVSLLLRSVMAPVLESFILLDRFQYLQESGAHPLLVPLFNEALSPRNMVIIAFKL